MTRPNLDDAALLALDVPSMISSSLAAGGELPGTAAVAAALVAARLGTRARALTFLAEIVRRGGVGYAARLAAPLPTPEQAALATAWLLAADGVTGGGTARDEAFACWLDKVATVLAVRDATT